MSDSEIQKSIEQRAFEMYVQRGGLHGSDQHDWLQAEKEICSQQRTTKTSKRGSPRS